MTNIKPHGRTTVYESSNGTLSNTDKLTLFAARSYRIHRVIHLLGFDQRGPSPIACQASRISAIAQRRRAEKPWSDARTDRAPGLCGFDLALIVSVAEEAMV